MNLIACVDSNWGIGKDNELLVHIPEDMKYFRKKTINNVVIMGRKTFESFPNGPLKNRVNIVITANPPKEKVGNEVYVSSIEECMAFVEDYDLKDVFVIGGASIYRQFLGLCDTAYITKVHKSFEADAYFPNLDEASRWDVVEESEEYDYDGIKYNFVTYKIV